MKINHIGIAVRNIEEFLRNTEPVYGTFSRGPAIINNVQRVREMFITDGNTVLELLEPLSEDSPLTGFLKRNSGGGVVHIALDVENLEIAIERAEQAGGRVIVDPVPDIAFDQRRIAFVLLSDGVYEFVETTHRENNE